MTDLIVVAFDNETGAEQMRDALVGMQKRHLLTLEDAAVVVRKQDGKVKVKQAVNLVGTGAVGGSFWGMLIGIIFWMPWLGAAIGALSGAVAGMFTDIGVDDSFIKEVAHTVEPGHSALFLLVKEATPEKMVHELGQYNGKLLQTSLSAEDEVRLKDLFGMD